MMATLAGFVLICALVPAVVFLANLVRYLPPPAIDGRALPAVSILIPARDEALAIGDALRSALASVALEFEIVVMDDGSSDGTEAIVVEYARKDARVRLERARPLPAGWNGKQHACWALAHAARNPLLCFVDADVRLEPECVRRMTQFLEAGGNGLVSGFPRQVTKTYLEWMLLPLIHFVLLGFLPLGRMRAGTDPAFAAGCGQFMLVRRDDYFACGGHSGIQQTMHDGLRLPRLFRAAGFRTDLADITALARCRMYRNAREVWSGLAKNATEGLGAPARIGPVTLLLALGQVLPFFLVVYVPAVMLRYGMNSYRVPRPTGWQPDSMVMVWIEGCFVLACIAAWLPRILGASRFRQDGRSALLHPLGVLLLLGVQWYALARRLYGGSVSWRGRDYTGG